METESRLMAEASEALIIAEKQPASVQQIHAECDKQFVGREDDIAIADDSVRANNVANMRAEREPDSEDGLKAPADACNGQNGQMDAPADDVEVENVEEVEEVEQVEQAEEVDKEIEVGQPVKHDVDELSDRVDELQIEVKIEENQEKEEEEEKKPIVIDEVKHCEKSTIMREEPVVIKDIVKESMARIQAQDSEHGQKEILQSGPRKGAVATSMDSEAVRSAYNDVRDDSSDTQWAVFKYDATRIVCAAKGATFERFAEQFDDDARAFGYIRLQTGDEMSKRHKFLFVAWIGPGVSVLKRAKMSIDKAIIKNVISNFAVELQLESQTEFDLPFFVESLNKASGANYGTGVREI